MSCPDFWPPVTMTTLNFPESYLDNVLSWLLTSCHHDNLPGLDEEESVIFTVTPLLTQEVPSPMTPSTLHLQSSLSSFHIPHNELGLQTGVLISRISLGDDQLHSYTFGLQDTPWHHSGLISLCKEWLHLELDCTKYLDITHQPWQWKTAQLHIWTAKYIWTSLMTHQPWQRMTTLRLHKIPWHQTWQRITAPIVRLHKTPWHHSSALAIILKK